MGLRGNAVDWLILALVTFLAATIQSATGFGFALLSVATFLTVLNSAAAIQLIIIISLVISCVLWSSLRGQAPPSLLRCLVFGSVLGFPMGIFGYLHMDLSTLKLVIAVLVLVVALQTAWQTLRYRHYAKPAGHSHSIGRAMPFVIGTASGAMGSCLAMPGPVVMLYLSRTALAKQQIRATILQLFFFSYLGALLLQITMVGVDRQTWQAAFVLGPIAALGAAVGHRLARRISQTLFQWIVLFILISTGLYMLVNVLIV